MASPASQNPQQGREDGFTLIELLVSLTILTAILAILSSSLTVLSQNWNANAQRIEQLEMVSRAFDIFERDVSGLQRLVNSTGQTPRFIFTGSEQRLSFVTLEPAYPTQPGPYFVNYSVQAKGSYAELIRARAPYEAKMLTFPGATPANSVPLLQGQFKYRFSYAQKGPAPGAWAATWPKTDRMPDLFKLQMIDAQTGAPAAPAFVVALRTDAELSCLESSSSTCAAKSNGRLPQNESASLEQQSTSRNGGTDE